MRAWTATAAALLIAGTAAVRADGSGERAEHDVRVKIALTRRGATPEARIRVKNRGTSAEAGVLVEVHADTGTGTLLWTGTVDLGRHRGKSFRVRVVPPEGTAALVAVATLDGVADGNPEDNLARVDLPTAPGGGGGGGTGGTLASTGAGLYAVNCASCHGVDARGIGEARGLRGEEAEEIREAMREGEDEMPAFPAFGWSEARALEAFLADPEGAVPPPPPPPPPPPSGTAPTYAGQVKALLDSRCGACHTGKNASMNLRLDTFNQASSNAAAALASVQAGRMPKGGSLTAEEIALLQAWIDGGKQP